jgi:hypothetical protein
MRSVVVSMLPSLADLSKSRTLYSPSVKKSSPSRLVTFAANGSLSAPRRLSKPNAATIRQTRGYILPLCTGCRIPLHPCLFTGRLTVPLKIVSAQPERTRLQLVLHRGLALCE